MKDKHLNLIRRIVWEAHKQSGVDWDELFAEATLTYYIKLERYNEALTTGKQTTFLWMCIRRRLLNFIAKEGKHICLPDLTEYESSKQSNPTPFFEFFDTLSEDSKIIVNMVLDDPHEYLSVPSKMARGLVVQNLINDKGWIVSRSWEGIRSLRNEIKKI